MRDEYVGCGSDGVMAFVVPLVDSGPKAVSFSLRWECLRRGWTVLLRPSDIHRWRWGLRRIGTWTCPSDATLCAHSDGEAGVFVSLRAIEGRRCVPIGRARQHRSEPSSLEKSRTHSIVKERLPDRMWAYDSGGGSAMRLRHGSL